MPWRGCAEEDEQRAERELGTSEAGRALRRQREPAAVTLDDPRRKGVKCWLE